MILKEYLLKKVEECPQTNANQASELELVEEPANLFGVGGNEVKDVSQEWWGYGYGFESGGFLGAESRRKKSLLTENAHDSRERIAFHEEDQESLYKIIQDKVWMQVSYTQNKSTTGKQGLGIKDRPRKIAGFHFGGKKDII